MTNLSAEQFLTRALEIATTAATSQLDVIRTTAAAIADSYGAGGTLWAFGTGHSHMIAEEIWGRAGGLTEVKAILEPALMLHEGLQKSSLTERLPGMAEVLLACRDIGADDVVLIASNSGRNAVPVEFARGCKERGATVVALTSVQHSRQTTSRVPSGEKLLDIADIVIDNCGEPGDAIMANDPHPVGATSSMVGCMLVQALVVEVVAEMHRRGTPAPVLLSLNA
ncbi:sugar isomerase domain-containing protein [Parenemella sanctibonifatiensis]|uniref:SIS domain-containing protein n=1 Tax=Parenemella sanctibonifatiensis TaxID=2016505 RepID=A0A255ECK4_9ACTN|nr:SIS domain-containing protein [Parenemella sanctibonifatiensis]OYN88661.1 hypothetical protein CGZ91_13760 [Parenemella sanctibonifatiensis]